MDYHSLPQGLFYTLLHLFDIFKSCYVTVFEWFGQTAFGSDGTLIDVLFGTGIFVVLGYIIVKFLNPFS